MNDTLRFAIDLTNVQEADDGNTTYYGGTYLFNGEERRGRGNDRSDNYRDDITDSIVQACQAKWPELVDNGMPGPLDDLNMDVGDAFDEVDGLNVGTIFVTRLDDGTFLVAVDG